MIFVCSGCGTKYVEMRDYYVGEDNNNEYLEKVFDTMVRIPQGGNNTRIVYDD